MVGRKEHTDLIEKKSCNINRGMAGILGAAQEEKKHNETIQHNRRNERQKSRLMEYSMAAWELLSK